MATADDLDAGHVVARLLAAMNQHDVDGFVSCFADEYVSQQPVHPDRAFSGTAQVRKNWTALFDGVPDFKADLLRSAVAGDTAWTEWQWQGTRGDRTRFDMRGVIILRTRAGRVVHGCVYMESVEQGAGIDTAVRRLAGTHD